MPVHYATRLYGERGRPSGGDVTDAGPWVEFWAREETERWVRSEERQAWAGDETKGC